MHEVIRAKALFKHYGRARVLDDVSFSVASGESCAVIGPSGSGKSTLLNLVGLLDTPSAGEIEICGRSVRGASGTELAEIRNRAIGFIFQAFHLLPRLRLKENVALPLLYRGIDRREALREASAALGMLGIGDTADRFPDEVSGGQKQRAAIARAVIGRPEIILADEPTGNLDSGTANEVLELLLGLKATVVLVTHDLTLASRCARTVAVRDGRIA